MRRTPASCPLCDNTSINHYHQDTRDYWQCQQCALVFVDSSQHLNELEEKQRYDLHDNSVENEGYCRFLDKLLLPLTERLSEGAVGLDFGCGPGPTLSRLLERKGYSISCYDKYYADDQALLNTTYDFVCSTEVLEHLREPKQTLELLIKRLKPTAYLGIMTQLLPSVEKFPRWHYNRDPTHICFYAHDTFAWIAEHWDLQLEILDPEVIILGRGN